METPDRRLAVVDQLTQRLAEATASDQRAAALEIVAAMGRIAQDWPPLAPDAPRGVVEAHTNAQEWWKQAQVFGRLVRLTDDVHRSDEPRLM
ncbi:hypothetical protein GCM10027418_14990 [Mariniluteicoccus endophyticus]